MMKQYIDIGYTIQFILFCLQRRAAIPVPNIDSWSLPVFISTLPRARARMAMKPCQWKIDLLCDSDKTGLCFIVRGKKRCFSLKHISFCWKVTEFVGKK